MQTIDADGLWDGAQRMASADRYSSLDWARQSSIQSSP